MIRAGLSPHRVMCLIGFSSAAASSIIAPILSIFVKNAADASLAAVGLVTAVFFIVSSAAEFSLGVFAGGRRTIPYVFFAFIIFTLCHVFYPYTNNIMVIVALRAIQGFTSASIAVASLTLVGIAIPVSDRDKAVGIYTAWTSLGLLAGPAINLVTIPFLGISNSFFIATLIGVVGCLAAFTLYRRFSAMDGSWQIIGVSIERETVRERIAAIIGNRIFLVAWGANFVFFFFFGVLLTYSPFYVKERFGFSDEYVSLLFFMYYVTTILTRLSVGRIAKRVDKRTVIMLCLVCTVLFSFLMAIILNSFAFALIFALVGGIQGILFPVASMLVADFIQPSRIALANSLFLIGVDLGQATAPLLTAAIVTSYGIQYGFAFSAILATALLPFLAWLNHRTRFARTTLISE